MVKVYSIEGVTPVVHPSAYVHPSAVIIGDVVIGPDCYIGPNACLRGDFGRILIELLGRRVAKRLIHAALVAQMGSAPPLNEIVVARHPDGWPRVS